MAFAAIEMNLTLQRTSENEVCTQGVLTADSLTLYTLELPWVPDGDPGGTPDKSCVPAGVYQLVLHDTVKHPRSFALVNPDLGVIHEPDPMFPNARTACLIHIADTVADLEGCIGVGLGSGDCTISQSKAAYIQFQDVVPWVTGHTLTILPVN
jgi:hypothetical protein